MGLFDKLKGKNQSDKVTTQVIYPKINNGMGFCSCGNTTYEQYCRNCNKKIIKTISSKQYSDILNNKIIIPLSNNYDINFNEIKIGDYFNLTLKQEEHIIYRLIHDIIFRKCDDDIVNHFDDILEETKNNGYIDKAFANEKISEYKKRIELDDIERLILKNIKLELINNFHNSGFKYNRTTTVKSVQYINKEIPVTKDKHGGITKGVATLGFGLLGFAATSGVETKIETKQIKIDGEYIHRQYMFNEKYISIKAFSDNLCVNHFDPEKTVEKVVIDWEDIKYIDDENSLILKSGDVIQIKEPVFDEIIYKNIFKILGVIGDNSNYFLKLRYIDKLKNVMPKVFYELLNEHINKNNKLTIDNSNSEDNSINELEKLVSMYEKGLLRDDEFNTMKQNIIGNNVEMEENTPIRFCGNCGAEIIDNSKFCIQCGTKLN